MKINSQTPLTRPTQTSPRDEAQQAKGANQTSQQTPDSNRASASTHLSQAATDTSRDIDTARVDEIREAISEGRLEVRADRIADRLIESLQQTATHDKGEA